MKKRLFCVILAACLLLSACGILPKEEALQKAPLIQNYQQDTWKLAYVQRGDMVLSQTVICTYVPVQTETLSFSVGGVSVDEVFVAVGDQVQEGQLLAQLDITGVQESIEDCNRKIEKLQLQIAAVEENRRLALERETILLAGSSEEALASALQKLQTQYDLQRQPLQDDLDITQMQLEEYQQQLLSRQLRAGISGTVTYLRPVGKGDYVTAGERMIVIEDSTSSTFRTDSRHWARFKPGQEYVITVDEEEYTAVVVSETDIGLPETEKVEGTYAFTYFRLKEQAAQLEDGDRGVLTLVLDSREDVLMIPESAVTRTKNKTVVYYQDANGLKAYKTVEVGLVASDMIEIISGLAEGECVIVG